MVSDHSSFFSVDQVVVIRLGKENLRMFILIMAFKSEGQIKTDFLIQVFIGFHRSVMLVLVLSALAKLPTVCNVASRKNRFRIDYN